MPSTHAVCGLFGNQTQGRDIEDQSGIVVHARQGAQSLIRPAQDMNPLNGRHVLKDSSPWQRGWAWYPWEIGKGMMSRHSEKTATSLDKVRWSGWCSFVAMPLPDLTPCDFFLWGYVKDKVYVPPMSTTLQALQKRGLDGNMLLNKWTELNYRWDVCRVTKGAHFEHL
ncbi:hypothetical protein AVEN_105364-1 [Araneus ventricosus]|uniref:Uncharacterized protein n=1 Tax=Araneus ventricosus TaxID=182803 RepID=A0A4Y2U3B3_ARAVE|nr:hypothetical protein AVEN_105364-1 [Araneus ventricosus]